MTQKNATIAVAALLLLGAGAVAVHQAGKAQTGTSRDFRQEKRPAPVASAENPPATGGPEIRKPRPRPQSPYQDLSARFGESRVRQSERVAHQIAGLLKDYAEVAELNISGRQGRVTLQGLERQQEPLIEKLGLADEQKKKAIALLVDHHRQEIVRSREGFEGMERDPQGLMEALLRDDAFTRGEISPGDYDATGGSASDMMKESLSSGISIDSLKPVIWSDPGLRKQLEGMLDPAQAAILREELAVLEEARKSEVRRPEPPMDLDALEKSIAAQQQAAKGMVMMLQGSNAVHEMNSNKVSGSQDSAGGR